MQEIKNGIDRTHLKYIAPIAISLIFINELGLIKL